MEFKKVHNDKSISELEGWKWDSSKFPNDSTSGIENRFFKLHDIPLNKLEIDDIRFLINQNSALTFILPIAILSLEKNFFVETEYYEGDLINSILNINLDGFWNQNLELKNKIISLIIKNQSQMEFIDLDWETKKELKSNFIKFIQE